MPTATVPPFAMSDSDSSSAETELPGLSTGRRTVMGALAAGVGLGAVGGAAAQDEDDDHPDDDGDGDDDEVAEDAVVLSAALAASEHGVFSEAHGSFHVQETEDGAWEFLLHLEDIECVTQAHIHEGNSCESGPVVLPLALFTETPAGDTEGAQENLRHAGMDSPIAVTGSVEPGGEDGPDEELAQDIAENPSDYYVNVHTTHHPGGEMRGQLRGISGPAVAAPDVPDDEMDGNETVGGNQTVGGNDTVGGNETG